MTLHKTLYRFSPIETKEKLLEAIEYVVTQTTKLCKQTIGITLPINSLTIFSHFEDEFRYLVELAMQIGNPYAENNGPYVQLNAPIKVGGNTIEFLRIRKPDPYRMQVGCNDFVVTDYAKFKDKYLSPLQNLRLIVRDTYEMIEFFHSDFDVLAYVVSKTF